MQLKFYNGYITVLQLLLIRTSTWDENMTEIEGTLNNHLICNLLKDRKLVFMYFEVIFLIKKSIQNVVVMLSKRYRNVCWDRVYYVYILFWYILNQEFVKF